MIRSLVMRHHPDSLMQAAAAGDIDVVRTTLAHLPPLPNVCHIHVFCLHQFIVLSLFTYTPLLQLINTPDWKHPKMHRNAFVSQALLRPARLGELTPLSTPRLPSDRMEKQRKG